MRRDISIATAIDVGLRTSEISAESVRSHATGDSQSPRPVLSRFAIINYMRLLLDQRRDDEAMALTRTYAADVAKIYGSPPERQYLDLLAEYYERRADSAKEVATLRRTVETIKHNLRKKLSIDGPSEAFMRRISTATPSEFDAMAAAR